MRPKSNQTVVYFQKLVPLFEGASFFITPRYRLLPGGPLEGGEEACHGLRVAVLREARLEDGPEGRALVHELHPDSAAGLDLQLHQARRSAPFRLGGFPSATARASLTASLGLASSKLYANSSHFIL